MKTIVFREWIKGAGQSRKRSRFILDQFDVRELKRGKRAPGRARRTVKKRPRARSASR
jgi:hypothetical protein